MFEPCIPLNLTHLPTQSDFKLRACFTYISIYLVLCFSCALPNFLFKNKIHHDLFFFLISPLSLSSPLKKTRGSFIDSDILSETDIKKKESLIWVHNTSDGVIDKRE